VLVGILSLIASASIMLEADGPSNAGGNAGDRLGLVSEAAPQDFSPARFRDGRIPRLAANLIVAGGGQVFVELTVGSDGRVTDAKALRATTPFTTLVVDAVGGWQFRPAEEEIEQPSQNQKVRRPVPSKVLVAGLFRPPTIYGPTVGEAPRDVASPSGETPFPASIPVPPFPQTAYTSGVVLVEVQVSPTGAVIDATLVRSASPFDDAALDAARKSFFQPPRANRGSAPAIVYMLFGFPIPVLASGPRNQ
jgi:TonB family protein